jgi:exodeoxyribonuclease V alpha subunit
VNRWNRATNAGGEEVPAWLPPLADALAEALPRLLLEEPEPRLQELIRALTAALASGEPELALDAPAPAGIDPRHWPDDHLRALEASALGRPPQGPLVLEPGRIVWRRWWEQRQGVLAALIRRAAADPSAEPQPTAKPAVVATLQGLDPEQCRAVEAVLHHRLVLLQGGPGTGKTSTVARMIRRLKEQHTGARVHLAAPTGKAAARLRAATDGVAPCTTLHRLLESRGDGFARDHRHPLDLDLLVVDEVSMVDLALMAAVLDALPDTCRLVLVGDPAQLPPVAPGALLAELQRPAALEALGEAVITLRTVHRNAGAIAAIASQLRGTMTGPAGAEGSGTHQADPLRAVRASLAALGAEDNLIWRECPIGSLPSLLLEPLAEHRQRLGERARTCPPGDSAAERALLEERDRLLVLAPRRRGRWGVEAIHRALLGAGVLEDPRHWPPGTPALCGRNLPELGLANGDVGVMLAPDPLDGEPHVLFGPGDGTGGDAIRLHPAQLAGSLEPALALTVHKAQGSEADAVIVLLPPEEPRDPRLLYTALTRARERALLISPISKAT